MIGDAYTDNLEHLLEIMEHRDANAAYFGAPQDDKYDDPCTCEDYDPTCRHERTTDAGVCPDCGARRDCPVHGWNDDA